jgi:hypothetical protein
MMTISRDNQGIGESDRPSHPPSPAFWMNTTAMH